MISLYSCLFASVSFRSEGRADFSDFPREGSRREDSHWGPASAGEVYAGAAVGNCRPIGRARPGIRTLNHFAFAFVYLLAHKRLLLR